MTKAGDTREDLRAMPTPWWRLQRLRRRRGFTQAALARKIGGHVMTISQLERGVRQPSMAMLHRLAKALGVSVAKLLE
jgi:transcriptional regulator with XRE-family HTH domain